MKDLKFFLRQNAVLPQNEEVEVTQRFKDENGSPIKFEIKPISNELDDELRKQNTRQVKRAKGVYVPGQSGISCGYGRKGSSVSRPE